MSVPTKILLLEDKELQRELLFELFEDEEDYEIRRAGSVAEAKEKLAGFTPNVFLFDLVIDGNKMVVINWIKELRRDRQYAKIPIVFVTAYQKEMEQFTADIANATTLPKPFDFEQLTQAIRAALSQQRNSPSSS